MATDIRGDIIQGPEPGNFDEASWHQCACGYDLRATPIDSRCPECGSPVMLVRGPFNGNIAWICQLRLGIIWLTIGSIGMVVLSIVVFGLTDWSINHKLVVGPVLALLIQARELRGIYFPLAIMIGSWHLSTREQGGRPLWLWLTASTILLAKIYEDCSRRLFADFFIVQDALYAIWMVLLCKRFQLISRRMHQQWLSRWSALLFASLIIMLFLCDASQFEDIIDFLIRPLPQIATWAVNAGMDYSNVEEFSATAITVLTLAALATSSLFWGLLSVSAEGIECRMHWAGWRMGPQILFRRIGSRQLL